MCDKCKNTGYYQRWWRANNSECSHLVWLSSLPGVGRLSSSMDYKVPYCTTEPSSSYDDGGYGGNKCRCPPIEEKCECECCKDKNKDKGGCFITTATCQSKNLPDNSYELNAFRDFRDKWLKLNFPKLVEEYYQIAPLIVAKIEQYQDSKSIYQEIWENHLAVCLNLLENRKEYEAKEQYMIMVHKLENKFLK